MSKHHEEGLKHPRRMAGLGAAIACVIVGICVGCAPTEDDIRSEVRTRLEKNATTAPLDLSIEVKERVVYLGGKTDSVEEQRQAVALARAADGVRLVVNDMWLNNAALANKVKQALASDPMVANLPIEIEVQGNLVRLSSDQTNGDERARAVQIASAVAGVAQVEDRMR